jgi:hypothetical protein
MEECLIKFGGKMDIVMILQWIAALGTVMTGLLALVKPSATYAFIGLSAEGSRGVSEIRSIFGGLFIALGLAPFFLGEAAYQMLGIAYLGIALARAFSIVFDRSYANSNLISLVIEVIFGVVLIL